MFVPLGDNIYRRSFPVLAPLLIAVNVIVFIVELRVDDPASFVKTWGLVPVRLASGEPLGLLTHMFLHGGIGHLLGNMFVLWAFSGSLELVLGRWSLLGVYILFGVAGGVAQAAMTWSSDIPIIGASGAIAGLIGAYMIFFGLLSRIEGILFLWLTPVRISVPAWLFCAGWFGLQWYYAEADAGLQSGVAWHAHLGGFLAGMIVAAICRNDTECDVRMDQHGNLTLAPTGNQDLSATDSSQLEPNWTPLEDNCPYCQAELGEHDRIGPNLARCGNASCARLIPLALSADRDASLRR